MSKKFLLVIFVLLILILLNPTVVAIKSSGTTNYEREIESNDYFWGYFSTLKEERDMSDEVDVEFTSNIPVNLYIFKSGDFNINSPDYSKADYSEEGIIDSEFSYQLEEDISYTLVISNPNYNKTASFTCKITEYFGFSDDDDENDVLIFGSWGNLILVVVMVVVVIIIAVIYFIIKTRKDRERDYRSFFREPQSTQPHTRPQPQQQYSYDDYYSQQRPPRPPY